MRIQKIKLWPFTKKETNSSTASNQLPEPKNILFENILSLPLYNYIQCKCKKNYSALIISGTFTDEDLSYKWIDIQSEVSELTSDDILRRYLRIKKECIRLSGRIVLIETLAKTMYNLIDYNAEAAAVMNKLCGTKFKFKEDKLLELNRCLNRMGSLKMNLELKLQEVEKTEKFFDDKKSKDVDEQYFYSTLVTMSETVHLDDKISTYEFFERLNRIKKQTKENGSKRTRRKDNAAN